jgi:phosphoribosylformylglycinamidine synthase PurS subunit
LRVKVYITPRQGILDPQARAIEHSLKSLGFNKVDQARMGKYIELDVTADSAAEVKRMCEQLLANTVIEDYRFGAPNSTPISGFIDCSRR